MINEKSKQLHGVLTAILTPLDLHGDLAPEHFPALLDFQRNAGIDGVIISGTNGEGTSLSVAERKQALETALAHKSSLTVLAGTGAASLTDALDLTRHAASVGAEAVLVLPPFFYKNPTPQGLADYFLPILDAAEIPVLLYNIPQHSAIIISDDLLALLGTHPNLAGIKDSTGDWKSTLHYLTAYPHLKIFAGSDLLACRSFQNGGNSISGGANAFPECLVAVRDGVKHSAEKGEAAQTRLEALIAITTRYPFIGVSKSILAHRGLPRLGVRPPLVSLTPMQEESLLAELRKGGFLA